MLHRIVVNLTANNSKFSPFCKHYLLRHASDDAYKYVPEFKSALSLTNIYPKSNLDLSSSGQVPSNESRFTGYIPMEELTVKYARSGKPGGQHVNKTNTKVCISLNLSSAKWIPQETREKLAVIHRNNISKEGFWLIRSEKTRVQRLNLADCLDKLRCYITEADRPVPQPSEETLELKRLQAERAAERRLRDKRHRKMLKLAKSLDF